MSYSENLVQLILDVVNHHGTQAEMIKIAEEALQAQREACARAFLLYKYSPSGRLERADWSLNDLAIAHEEAEIAQSILKAEVQP